MCPLPASAANTTTQAASLQPDSQRLHAMLSQNPILNEILTRFDEVNLPNAYLVAGCVSQTIWNITLGRTPNENLSDIDIIYFDDIDLSGESEEHHENRLRSLFESVLAPHNLQLDVKNEARVHLWYRSKFGFDIPPYTSAHQAIQCFHSTAACIGVRTIDAVFDYYAPYGTDDLFALTARANKTQITQDVYEAKTARWSKAWPELTIIPW